MPAIEFICDKCKKSFIRLISISEFERNNIRCPECKSTTVKQQITSKKS